MRLYRPVGQAEYDLIVQTGFTAYPPRLPEQPIFYPVLNECYAREIAEKWEEASAFTGFFLRFWVRYATLIMHKNRKGGGAGWAFWY